MNRVVYPKEKELTVMAQKKKDSKMMGKIIKTAVSGVLCVALAGGMVEMCIRDRDAIYGLPPYVFVMLGLYAGLRREEILGLQWDSHQ